MSTKPPAVRSVSAEPALAKHINARGLKLGLPVSGNFELTARCNFSCRMCYIHKNNSEELRRKELSADAWLSLASDARDEGMIFLLLTGGEPFLRSDFPYLYEQLIKMGIIVSVNTNASLYNDEIRALFNKYPPSRINVTLYGGSNETYESLCGNPSFDKVVANLRKMKEDGQQVRLNVSLTPYNVGDMEQIDLISREVSLQAKAASYMYPPMRADGTLGVNEARFTPEKAGEVIASWNALREPRELYIRKAERLRACLDADVKETCSDVEQEGVTCRAGRSSFWMTWDGRMMPCGTMESGIYYPLEIGFKSAWEKVREFTAGIRLPMECASCENRVNCGVCASICKCETGSFDKKPEYLCAMTKSLTENTILIADKMKGENLE